MGISAPGFDRPLRLLWIDGDHQYASTKQDFDLFVGHLATGGILAMHDVLSRYDGCIRVFCEEVLDGSRFGAVGICGSIGWAQYLGDRSASLEQARSKQRLRRQLNRLLPYHCQSEPPRGLAKLRYRWLRARIPHKAMSPARWIQRLQAA